MKAIILTGLISGMALVSAVQRLSALYDSGFQNGGVISDGSPNGLTDTRTVSDVAGSIDSVKVTLNMSGGYTGDFYAYLTHGTGFAVLLNRVGLGSAQGDGFGVSGSGINVTFTSSGSDIHFNYGGVGTYGPDGRAIDPLSAPSAFDSASTSASFSTFNNLNPNGNWMLFVSDVVQGGGQATLNSWSLEINAVPEPITWARIAFVSLLAGGKLLSWRRGIAGWLRHASHWAAGS